MPNVLIDDLLYERLQECAAANHRSADEEARELLRTAISHRASDRPRENIVDATRRLFGPKNGVELDIPPRGSISRRPPPDFSEH